MLTKIHFSMCMHEMYAERSEAGNCFYSSTEKTV